EQLLVICGDKGSGKSTLTAALASELDDYNCALIICPQHADSAEIRRKILVQLISAPIFDDERPLMDTVLRIQSSLTKPLHIIID
ncbi:ATP-binding protein, partial [Pseudomonas sp. HY2-MNA-CIBAN-0224]